MDEAKELVKIQAADEAIWLVGSMRTASEAYLLVALRALHAVVENRPDKQVFVDAYLKAVSDGSKI